MKTVKQRLVNLGIRQCEIAKELDVSKGSVSNVLNGKSRSYKIEKHISELTGYNFPEYKRVPRSLNS